MAIAKKSRSKTESAAGTRAAVKPAASKKAKKPGAKAGSKGGDDDEGSTRSNPLGLEIDAEVLEFIEALDQFRHSHNRPFPSWSEVLHVLRGLGYKKS